MARVTLKAFCTLYIHRVSIEVDICSKIGLQIQGNACILGMRADELESNLRYGDCVRIVNLPQVHLGQYPMRENGSGQVVERILQGVDERESEPTTHMKDVKNIPASCPTARLLPCRGQGHRILHHHSPPPLPPSMHRHRACRRARVWHGGIPERVQCTFGALKSRSPLVVDHVSNKPLDNREIEGSPMVTASRPSIQISQATSSSIPSSTAPSTSAWTSFASDALRGSEEDKACRCARLCRNSFPSINRRVSSGSAGWLSNSSYSAGS